MLRCFILLVMRAAVTMLLLFLSPIHAESKSLPDGMAFAGLIDSTWQIYTVQDDRLEPISEIKHPRTFTAHLDTGLIAYIGADSQLDLYASRTGIVLPELKIDAESRYTQPSFSADGRWLLAVELPGGKSRRTNIIGFDMGSGSRYGYVRKRTAQFEPFMGSDRYLHYSTAVCVDDCGGMIWELWRRDMHTGKQVQLTLLNAISNQPYVHEEKLFFSSNADGGRFHIWVMDDEIGAPPRQLTNGDVRDSDPVVDDQGVLYFLRKTDGRTFIMKSEDDEPRALDISERFEDIRNLEISR